MSHFTEAAVTDVGNELLNEMMAGRYVRVTRAAGGTGTVEKEKLHEQTEMQAETQSLSIIDDVVDKQGRTIAIQIGNAEESYPLEQVGVFGKLEDAEEERLLFILQDRDPITVPDKSAPTFMLNIYSHLNINNVGRFTVTIDKTGIVNIEYLERKLAEIKPVPGEGAPTPETAGQLGQHYFDGETGIEYICKQVNEDGTYVWEEVGHTMVDDADPETTVKMGAENGELFTQTSKNGEEGEKVFMAKEETSQEIRENTEVILAELRGQRPKRYGYRVKISEPNPADRVEYLFDAVGMTPAHMNYEEQRFEYGDWKDIWFVRDNYPCMVRADGSEDYRLDPSDYTKRADGSGASDVTNQQYEGNGMSAIPLVWVCRYQEGGYRYVIFCESQYDESYKAYAHTRPDGTIAKHAYHALFEGSMIGGKLRSIAGDDVYPQSGTTAQAELTAAKANGDKWSIRNWSLTSLIADLCTLISKTCNSQEAFGQGNTTGYYKNGVSGEANGANEHYGFCACGSLKDKGQFFGYGPETTTKAVKVFHIENLYGDRWDRGLGLVLDKGVPKVKMTPEGDGYNLTGAGYTAIGTGVFGETADSGGGYQHLTEQTEFGCLPVGPFDGSDAIYETDYYWWNRTDVRVALLGGACAGGARCGVRFLHLANVAAYTSWALGASLTLEDPS